MAVLDIRLFGDPVLKQRSDPVTRFDAELARFGDDLLETLRAAHGAGLAAPQVGVLKRMFAYDIQPDEETGEHPFGVLVNPVITRWEGEQDGEEGCLSFPGLYYACKRALKQWREREFDLEFEGIEPHLHRSEITKPDKTL